MDSYKNKLIPTKVNAISSLETQIDFCNNSQCEDDELLDCGECMFSENYCKKQIFEEWKLNKENKNEQDGK